MWHQARFRINSVKLIFADTFNNLGILFFDDALVTRWHKRLVEEKFLFNFPKNSEKIILRKQSRDFFLRNSIIFWLKKEEKQPVHTSCPVHTTSPFLKALEVSTKFKIYILIGKSLFTSCSIWSSLSSIFCHIKFFFWTKNEKWKVIRLRVWTRVWVPWWISLTENPLVEVFCVCYQLHPYIWWSKPG